MLFRSTKKKALEKLKNFKLTVGSPELLREDPLLDYKSDDPWGNSVKMSEWRHEQAIKLVGVEVYEKLIKSSNRKLNSERKKIKKATKSFSGFSLFLALDNSKVSNPPKLNHHTVFFPEKYEEEFVDLFDRGEPVKDPAIYICAPNDPQMRPPGNFEAWSILVNAPLHNPEFGIDWRKIESKYAQNIIKKQIGRAHV